MRFHLGATFEYLGPLGPWVVLTTLLTVVAIGVSRFWKALRPFGWFVAFAPLAVSMFSQQLAIREAIKTAHALAIFNLEIFDELLLPVGRPDIFGAGITVFCLLLNGAVGKGLHSHPH